MKKWTRSAVNRVMSCFYKKTKSGNNPSKPQRLKNCVSWNSSLSIYLVFDGAASTSDNTVSNSIMRCERIIVKILMEVDVE